MSCLLFVTSILNFQFFLGLSSFFLFIIPSHLFLLFIFPFSFFPPFIYIYIFYPFPSLVLLWVLVKSLDLFLLSSFFSYFLCLAFLVFPFHVNSHSFFPRVTDLLCRSLFIILFLLCSLYSFCFAFPLLYSNVLFLFPLLTLLSFFWAESTYFHFFYILPFLQPPILTPHHFYSSFHISLSNLISRFSVFCPISLSLFLCSP